jgi:hypothetical protein
MIAAFGCWDGLHFVRSSLHTAAPCAGGISSIRFGVQLIRMFNLSDDVKKLKTKVLMLSGVSLFIALTQALPQKVAIIGLDLSRNETMAGWFILAVTTYFLVSFLISSAIEIIKYYLPSLITRQTVNTTGDTIGLTVEECYPNDEEDTDIGTTSGELKEIDAKNKRITYKYKSYFIRFSNAVKLITEFVFPIIFSFVSLGYLYCFLAAIQ